MERKGGKVERERKLKTKENEKETKKTRQDFAQLSHLEKALLYIYTHTHTW